MLAERALEVILAAVLSGALGVFGTLFATRRRLDRVEWRLDAWDATQAKRDREASERDEQLRLQLAAISRRQHITLNLLANVAHGTGMDRRAIDDAVSRFLAEGSDHP